MSIQGEQGSTPQSLGNRPDVVPAGQHGVEFTKARAEHGPHLDKGSASVSTTGEHGVEFTKARAEHGWS